VSSNH